MRQIPVGANLPIDVREAVVVFVAAYYSGVADAALEGLPQPKLHWTYNAVNPGGSVSTKYHERTFKSENVLEQLARLVVEVEGSKADAQSVEQEFAIYRVQFAGRHYTAIARGAEQTADYVEIHRDDDRNVGDFSRVIIGHSGNIAEAARIELTGAGQRDVVTVPASAHSEVPKIFKDIAAAVLADRPRPVPYVNGGTLTNKTLHL